MVTISIKSITGLKYVFEVNPTNISITKQHIVDRIQQSDGTRLSYTRAKKWRFAFEFEYITKSMWESLVNMRNSPEPYTLILLDIYPEGTYTAAWIGDMSMRYWSPLATGGFAGTMELEEI